MKEIAFSNININTIALRFLRGQVSVFVACCPAWEFCSLLCFIVHNTNHVIGEKGCEVILKNANKCWHGPATTWKVWGFLGHMSDYWWFILNYARIEFPFHRPKQKEWKLTYEPSCNILSVDETYFSTIHLPTGLTAFRFILNILHILAILEDPGSSSELWGLPICASPGLLPIRSFCPIDAYTAAL